MEPNNSVTPTSSPLPPSRQSRQQPESALSALSNRSAVNQTAVNENESSAVVEIADKKLGPRSAWFARHEKKVFIGMLVSLISIFGITVAVLVSTGTGSNKQNVTLTPVKKLPCDLSKLTSEEKSRIDCFLEEQSHLETLTRYQCELRGCIYKPSKYQKVPDCFFDRQNVGYKLDRSIENNLLKQYDLKRNQNTVAPFGQAIDNIRVKVEYLGKNVINVKIIDPNNDRYEVPFELYKPAKLVDSSQSLGAFQVVSEPNGLFAFQIVRRSNNEVLFDTTDGALVYSDQYLQFSTKLPSENLYGFGENNHEQLKHDLNFKSWGIFAKDWSPGWGDNTNNYGHQSAYYVIENSGKSHAVLLYNSNAMEYLLTPMPSLTMRTIGGILDLYFVIDEKPELVVQNYHQLIGLPIFPPYWTLGYQMSRWGYKNLDELKQVIDRTRAADLFHDVQYMDIDYMRGYRVFTIDQTNFKGLGEYVQLLRSQGMRMVLIIDPGVVMEDDNEPYTRGLARDVFLKWAKYHEPYDRDNRNGQDIIGWCWPNAKISYPDFFHSETQAWFQDELDRFTSDDINGCYMDGVWIDMNEPASFNTNELKPWNWNYDENDEAYPFFTLKCPPNRWEDPPYRTKNTFAFDDDETGKQRLSSKTICMTAEHRMDNKSFLHYDVHSLYAHTNAIVTYKSLINLRSDLRPFSLTRSNFVGTGNYTTHWLGDNDSTWKHLRMSLIGIMEYNFFGFPMVGADICGFWMDVVDAEMCTRWHQVGAFYTFSRNHNSENPVNKDPASFKNKTLEDSTREVYRLRYSILPHMYTLLYKSHIFGGSVTRPLFFEFPTDKQALNVDQQFLLGSSLLISPVVYPGHTSVKAYFPPESRWFDFRTGAELKANKWVDLNAPLDYINVHLRGGSILPMQEPHSARNTRESRKNPMSLVVALDQFQRAQGELFWDDGESFKFKTESKYFHAEFTYENNQLKSTVKMNKIEQIGNEFNLNAIRFFGLNKKPVELTINGQNQTFTFNTENNVVDMGQLNLRINVSFVIQFQFD